MAMHHYYLRTGTITSCQWRSHQQNSVSDGARIFTKEIQIYMTQDNQFASLESVFRRRLFMGIGTASVVALGANFGGITSTLLGLSPDGARTLKLDVIYPIGGYTRCLDANEGFEFVYPSNWVGDQTVLYRAAGKVERSLDPPSLSSSNGDRRGKNVNEPVVAFGPPGSNGELNVSVIVAPVPIDFSIETFGGAKEVGEAIVEIITGSRKFPNVKGTLIQAKLREDSKSMTMRNQKFYYYTLEFKVESPAFQRHNVAVCCARGGKLFTLNSQAPESIWTMVKTDFYRIADSFSLTSS